MKFPVPGRPSDNDGTDDKTIFFVNDLEVVGQLKQAAAYLERQPQKILDHAKKLLYIATQADSPFTEEGARKLEGLTLYRLLELWYMDFRDEDIGTKLRQFIDQRIAVEPRKGESVERSKVAKVDKKAEYQEALAVLLKALALVS